MSLYKSCGNLTAPRSPGLERSLTQLSIGSQRSKQKSWLGWICGCLVSCSEGFSPLVFWCRLHKIQQERRRITFVLLVLKCVTSSLTFVHKPDPDPSHGECRCTYLSPRAEGCFGTSQAGCAVLGKLFICTHNFPSCNKQWHCTLSLNMCCLKDYTEHDWMLLIRADLDDWLLILMHIQWWYRSIRLL